MIVGFDRQESRLGVLLQDHYVSTERVPLPNTRTKHRTDKDLSLTLFSVDIGILGLSSVMLVMSSSPPNGGGSDKRPGRLLSPQRSGGPSG